MNQSNLLCHHQDGNGRKFESQNSTLDNGGPSFDSYNQSSVLLEKEPRCESIKNRYIDKTDKHDDPMREMDACKNE